MYVYSQFTENRTIFTDFLGAIDFHSVQSQLGTRFVQLQKQFCGKRMVMMHEMPDTSSLGSDWEFAVLISTFDRANPSLLTPRFIFDRKC